MKTLFFAGNKRSGTSHLADLMNLHPRVFVSQESDIIWILYRLYGNKPLCPYPLDAPRGMEYSMKTCGHLLDRNKSPQENFFTFQTCLMEKGFPWTDRKTNAADLLWVGDKKPFQYSDPAIFEFILKIFPDARFIHMVRHPFAVVASVEEFKNNDGDFWLDLKPEEQIERWAMHEEQVLKLKKRAPVLDIKYEDLRKYPDREMGRVFDFLDLSYDLAILKEAVSQTRHKLKNMPEIACGDRARALMRLYGYEPKGSELGKIVLYLAGQFHEFKQLLKLKMMG